jgi:rhodanese-related sulfurtransferase
LRNVAATCWTDPDPIAPSELAARLGDGSVRLIDLRPSMGYRKEHIAGAIWSIRSRIAAALADAGSVPGPAPGQTVVLVADEPGLAALAAVDLAEAGVRDTRLLAGDLVAARAAGLPVVATPDTPDDAASIDFLFFTHDRHDGNAAAARQYLAWELGLLDQLDAQERSIFSVGGRVSALGR